MDDSEYFINIEQPGVFRKTVLEASKEIILTLKDFHKLQSIRQSKLELIEVLKDQIKELTFLMEKLDEKLPSKKIDYEKELFEQKSPKPAPSDKKPDNKPDKPVEAPEEKQPETPPKQHSEVDRLQDALASIEKKLNKL